MTSNPVVEKIVVRLAGDSGDGIQFAGSEFAAIQAMLGHMVQTAPDYPAEIRAPVGTLPGVSGFQLQFSSQTIHTPGDQADVLIALNPAALKTNLRVLTPGGLLIVNEDSFVERDLKKAGYEANPLTDDSLRDYQLLALPLTQLTLKTLAELKLPRSKVLQCRNVFILGILFYLYSGDVVLAQKRLAKKFAKDALVLAANQLALKAGFAYAEASELFAAKYQVESADIPRGDYRYISGNEAFAYAMATLGCQSERDVLVAGYPITPASTVLHKAASLSHFHVKTFQAEDEIAAMCATLGAAFGGHLGITITSGPGLDLKGEAIGLAVMTELPSIIINVQRAGPSTGMPTKVEQGDLLQAIHGRHGECPLPVYAPSSPADCFDLLLEVAQVAVDLMTPVIILSDAQIANGMVPWRIPELSALPDFKLNFAEPTTEPFEPYQRNASHAARPWAIPGTPGLMHRIGGLEKAAVSGKVSYEPDNHQQRVIERAERIEQLSVKALDSICEGPDSGEVLVVTWGGCFGPVRTAVANLQKAGHLVTVLALRQLFPLPDVLGKLIKQFDHIAVAELNHGQLAECLRAKYLIPIKQLNKISGAPLLTQEVETFLQPLLTEKCHD